MTTQEMQVTITTQTGQKVCVESSEGVVKLWLDGAVTSLTQKEINYLSDVFSGLFDSKEFA